MRNNKQNYTRESVAQILVHRGIVTYANFQRDFTRRDCPLFLEYEIDKGRRNSAKKFRILRGCWQNMLCCNFPELIIMTDGSHDRKREYFQKFTSGYKRQLDKRQLKRQLRLMGKEGLLEFINGKPMHNGEEIKEDEVLETLTQEEIDQERKLIRYLGLETQKIK